MDLVHFCSIEDVKGYIEKKAMSVDIDYEKMFSQGHTPESLTLGLAEIATKNGVVYIEKQQDGHYITSDIHSDEKKVFKITDLAQLDLGAIAHIAIDEIEAYKLKTTDEGQRKLLDQAIEEVKMSLQPAGPRIQQDKLKKTSVEDFALQCAKQRVESDLAQIAPGELQEWNKRNEQKKKILELLENCGSKIKFENLVYFDLGKGEDVKRTILGIILSSKLEYNDWISNGYTHEDMLEFLQNQVKDPSFKVVEGVNGQYSAYNRMSLARDHVRIIDCAALDLAEIAEKAVSAMEEHMRILEDKSTRGLLEESIKEAGMYVQPDRPRTVHDDVADSLNDYVLELAQQRINSEHARAVIESHDRKAVPQQITTAALAEFDKNEGLSACTTAKVGPFLAKIARALGIGSEEYLKKSKYDDKGGIDNG